MRTQDAWWRDAVAYDKYVQPGEPPEITALWIEASRAMERADCAPRPFLSKGRRIRQEALAEFYAILRKLRDLGEVVERKRFEVSPSHRPKEFRNSRWFKPLRTENHG